MSKKILLIFAFGLCISSYAQTEVPMNDSDHFVVKITGDTIYGKLKYMSSDDIKMKISVKVNDTLKYSLKASEVAYFRDGVKEYITFKPEGEESHFFLKVAVLGKFLSLYEWQIPLDGGGGKIEFYHYIQKPGQTGYTELLTPWHKSLVEFIDDNEQLADEVWKNKYKTDQLEEVIKKYNEWKEDKK